MLTSPERQAELLDDLTHDQVETVLSFVAALSNGRVVVSACDVPGDDAGSHDQTVPGLGPT